MFRRKRSGRDFSNEIEAAGLLYSGSPGDARRSHDCFALRVIRYEQAMR